MKKRICLLSIFCLCFVCTSCSKNNEAQTAIPKEAVEFTDTAAADTGIYYTSADKQEQVYASFFDYKTKKMVPLCQKPNCKHEDSSCPAYQLGKDKNLPLAMMAVYRKQLYLLYSDFTNGSTFMKADLDGSHRQPWLSVPKDFLINQAFFYQDTLFISCNVLGKMNKTDSGPVKTELYVHDEEKDGWQKVAGTAKNKDEFLTYIGFEKGKAYYIKGSLHTKKRPIYEYDLKDKSVKCINRDNTIETSMLYHGKLFFADPKDSHIKAYHIFSKQVEDIAPFKKHAGKLNQMSSDGIVRLNYVVHPDTTDSKPYMQAYDVRKKAFLFPDYKLQYDVHRHVKNGYIGSIHFEAAYFDKHMKPSILK